MHGLWNNIINYFAHNMWLIRVLSLLTVGFAISWIETSFYFRLRKRLLKTKAIWDEALLDAIHLPLQALIWGLTISLLIPIVIGIGGVGTNYLLYLSALRQIFFVVILFWVGMRFIRNIELQLQAATEQAARIRDRTSVHATAQLSRVVLIFLTVLTIMPLLGIKITTILAFGGVGGIAIALAAKDTLANFLGGMMIFWDRPFSVGDWIRSPDRNIEGTVEQIGWRLTRIRTFDKRPLYVPNAVFSTVSVENPSRMENRRIQTLIGVRYDDAEKIPQITAAIENMLREHDEIDTTKTLMVNFVEFATSSLNIQIYAFTKTTDWAKFLLIRQEVYLKTIDIIAQYEAECAFPTSTIHVPQRIALDKKGES